MEPISADNSFARSRTSSGNAWGARLARSGHSMRAATWIAKKIDKVVVNNSKYTYVWMISYLPGEGDGRLI